MALFICPNCEEHAEIKESNGGSQAPFMCPHCGREFMIDKELNIIVEEEV